MYKNKRILATVCARGGSKGIKNKNIRLLADKPLICYSLDILKQSKYIDQYIVSTDSDDISKVVQDHGFEIKFKRPAELAGDKVSRIDVIQHATKWAEEYFKTHFEIIIDLGVATPLKNAEDLDNSLITLIDSNGPNLLSVTPASRNPYFNMVEEVNNKIRKVKTLDKKITDRRDAPKVYEMNDAFNVFQHDTLCSKSPQFNDDTKIYVMPHERSVDIDEEIDFLWAELLLSEKNKEKK